MITWESVRRVLLAQPPGTVLRVAKKAIRRPESEGAVRSIGLPRGQFADWRFPPDAQCRGVHVHERHDGYRAHLDQVHPHCSLLGHILTDVVR